MFSVMLLLVVLTLFWAGNRRERFPLLIFMCLSLLVTGFITVSLKTDRIFLQTRENEVTSVFTTNTPNMVTEKMDSKKQEFVSSVRRFEPLFSIGEATGTDFGYNRLRINAEQFYDIAVEFNLNPDSVFAYACLVTGYGTSAASFWENDFFGAGRSFVSVPDSIRFFCSIVTEELSIPEVQEICSEIFLK